MREYFKRNWFYLVLIILIVFLWSWLGIECSVSVPNKEKNIQKQEVSQEIYLYWMPLRQDKIVRELFYFMFDDDGKLTYDEHERLKIYLEINSTEIQIRNEEVLNGTR